MQHEHILDVVSSFERGNLHPPPYSHAVEHDEAFYEAHIKDKYIVRFNEGHRMSPQAVRALTAQFSEQNELSPRTVFDNVLQGFSAEMSEQRAAALRNNPNIQSIVPIAAVNIQSYTQQSPEWGLDRIDQRDRPYSNSYSTDNEGDGVRVFVVDTGVSRTHVELTSRVTPFFDKFGDTNYQYQARYSEDYCPDPYDPGPPLNVQSTTANQHHGTHIAGVVAGNTYGVAKQADVYDVRVVTCRGGSTTEWIIEGLDRIASDGAVEKLSVINLSLGSQLNQGNQDSFEDLEEAIQQLIDSNNFVVVVSAGNDNLLASTASPARMSSVITVGASTRYDERASYSNYGLAVDIFAPGHNITSSTSHTNSSVRIYQGTSMAAPFVAGAVAIKINSFEPSDPPSLVISEVISDASTGKLTQLPSGTPNRLLYIPNSGVTNPPGGGGSEPPIEPTCPYLDENNNWVMCQ